MAQLNLANQENISVETIDDLTIYSDGVFTVYVTHNENDDYAKITVSRKNEDSYVWVHYEYANDSDNEKNGYCVMKNNKLTMIIKEKTVGV